jgi:hypothetical protein
VLTQGAGQANLRKVAVKLPLSLALDAENAAGDWLCEFEEGQKAEPNCPRGSIIGRAKAFTPVLNRPLQGPVFFVKHVRVDPRTGQRIRTLPTLLLKLRGEVALNDRATSAVKGGKLVNTFGTVPDAPVSRFELTINGGRRGILVSNANLCRRPRSHLADVDIDRQNGKRADSGVRITMPCKTGSAKTKRRSR